MMLGSFQLLLGMPKFAIRATASFLFQAACNRIFQKRYGFWHYFHIFAAGRKYLRGNRDCSRTSLPAASASPTGSHERLSHTGCRCPDG